jgi:hypothetical protein
MNEISEFMTALNWTSLSSAEKYSWSLSLRRTVMTIGRYLNGSEEAQGLKNLLVQLEFARLKEMQTQTKLEDDLLMKLAEEFALVSEV